METKNEINSITNDYTNEFDVMWKTSAIIGNWLDGVSPGSKYISKNSKELPQANAWTKVQYTLLLNEYRATIWLFSTCGRILKKYRKEYPAISVSISNIWSIISSASNQTKYIKAVLVGCKRYTIVGKKLRDAINMDIRKMYSRSHRLKDLILPDTLRDCGLSEYVEYLVASGTTIEADVMRFYNSDEIRSIDVNTYKNKNAYFNELSDMYYEYMLNTMKENGIKYTGLSEDFLRNAQRVIDERNAKKEEERINKLALKIGPMKDLYNTVVSGLENAITSAKCNEYINQTTLTNIIQMSVDNGYKNCHIILMVSTRIAYGVVRDPLGLDLENLPKNIKRTKALSTGIIPPDVDDTVIDPIVNAIKLKYPDCIVKKVPLGIGSVTHGGPGLTKMRVPLHFIKWNDFNMEFAKNKVTEYANSMQAELARSIKARLHKSSANSGIFDDKQLDEFIQRSKNMFILGDYNAISVGAIIRFHPILQHDESNLTDEEISDPTLLVPEETPDGIFATMSMALLHYFVGSTELTPQHCLTSAPVGNTYAHIYTYETFRACSNSYAKIGYVNKCSMNISESAVLYSTQDNASIQVHESYRELNDDEGMGDIVFIAELPLGDVLRPTIDPMIPPKQDIILQKMRDTVIPHEQTEVSEYINQSLRGWTTGAYASANMTRYSGVVTQLLYSMMDRPRVKTYTVLLHTTIYVCDKEYTSDLKWERGMYPDTCVMHDPLGIFDTVFAFDGVYQGDITSKPVSTIHSVLKANDSRVLANDMDNPTLVEKDLSTMKPYLCEIDLEDATESECGDDATIDSHHIIRTYHTYVPVVIDAGYIKDNIFTDKIMVRYATPSVADLQKYIVRDICDWYDDYDIDLDTTEISVLNRRMTLTPYISNINDTPGRLCKLVIPMFMANIEDYTGGYDEFPDGIRVSDTVTSIEDYDPNSESIPNVLLEFIEDRLRVDVPASQSDTMPLVADTMSMIIDMEPLLKRYFSDIHCDLLPYRNGKGYRITYATNTMHDSYAISAFMRDEKI